MTLKNRVQKLEGNSPDSEENRVTEIQRWIVNAKGEREYLATRANLLTRVEQFFNPDGTLAREVKFQ